MSFFSIEQLWVQYCDVYTCAAMLIVHKRAQNHMNWFCVSVMKLLSACVCVEFLVSTFPNSCGQDVMGKVCGERIRWCDDAQSSACAVSSMHILCLRHCTCWSLFVLAAWCNHLNLHSFDYVRVLVCMHACDGRVREGLVQSGTPNLAHTYTMQIVNC